MLSNAIKKEIVKTFLKNTCKPIPIICSEVCKKLNQTFIKDEVVIYNKQKYKIIDNADMYMIKNLENDKIESVAFEKLKRADEHSKNDVYDFLCENTTDTVFGKILKPNVVNELKKTDEKEKKTAIEKHKTVEKPKVIVHSIKTENPFNNFISDDMIAFEVFVFIVGHKKFLKTRGIDFTMFLELLRSEDYCFEIVKSLFYYIKIYKNEDDFGTKLRKAINLCKLTEEKDAVCDENWDAKQINQQNYRAILNSFFYSCSLKNSDKRFLCLIDSDIKHCLKFLIDFVITTGEFKKYIDVTMDTTKQREKTRFEINTKLRRINIGSKTDEDERKSLFMKHEEVEKLILKEKVKFCLGTHEGDFYLVNDILYKIQKNNIYKIEMVQIDTILKALKGTRENAQLAQILRQIREAYAAK